MAQAHGAGVNPFRPGDAPLVLAGRELIRDEIGDFVRLLGDAWRPVALEGPRGVGKTSLIEWADEPIAARGHIHVKLEARRGGSLFELLSRWLVANRSLLAELGVRASARAAMEVELAAGPVKVKRASPRPAPSEPSTDIEIVVALLDAIASRGAGLVISVDETQVGGARLMGDVGSILTAARQHAWPLNFLLAGLPAMRKLIGPNRRNQGSLGQLERATWLEVAPRLSKDETAFAIVEALQLTAPAWRMSAPAATRAFELTAGYPYAVQLLGASIWSTVRRPRRVDIDDIDAARHPFTAQLGSSLFQSRWRQMPTEERRYASVLARLSTTHGEVTNAQIAGELGKRPSQTTYLRERLRDGGLIVSGKTARSTEFITPVLAEFVLANVGDDLP